MATTWEEKAGVGAASPQPQLCSLQVGEGNTTAVRLPFQAHWLLPSPQGFYGCSLHPQCSL